MSEFRGRVTFRKFPYKVLNKCMLISYHLRDASDLRKAEAVAFEADIQEAAAKERDLLSSISKTSSTHLSPSVVIGSGAMFTWNIATGPAGDASYDGFDAEHTQPILQADGAQRQVKSICRSAHAILIERTMLMKVVKTMVTVMMSATLIPRPEMLMQELLTNDSYTVWHSDLRIFDPVGLEEDPFTKLGTEVDKTSMRASQRRSASEEIAFLQRNIQVPCLEKMPFQTVVNDVLSQHKEDVRISSAQLELLQAATESNGSVAKLRAHFLLKVLHGDAPQADALSFVPDSFQCRATGTADKRVERVRSLLKAFCDFNPLSPLVSYLCPTARDFSFYLASADLRAAVFPFRDHCGDNMADNQERSTIPSWDGQARTWRRYTREVSWFVLSTPVHKRRYCASRLLTRLVGPARLLAMSWSQMDFDTSGGTKLLLRRLASSPLVRRTLPNAAAICQQYFSFRRQPAESIGNFLVRETLVHEEFVEAIIRLHEEKLGVAQDMRDFGLPDDSEWETSWWEGGSWGGGDDYGEDNADGDPPGDSPADDGRLSADAGPGRADLQDDSGQPRGATGSSPSHRAGDSGSQVGSKKGESPGVKAPLDELSVADSFIMDVLRGWRLLQAAGLNAEEKRDILSTTKNSLDYSVISSALQSLWDDQLLGNHRHASGSYNMHMVDSFDDHTAYQQEMNDWWDDGTWGQDWWYDDAYTDHYEDPGWGDEDWPQEAQSMNEAPADPELAAKFQEAQQAERVAESLAAEATRTWTEAQRATQALRRDRGFGMPSNSAATGKCFLCGGNHFARECPDRFHQGSKGGKGYHRNYLTDMDESYAYYFNKGKSKGKFKGKGKKGMFMEAQAWMKGKGKNKGKGIGKDGPRSVNAYSSELFLGGLEVSEVFEAAASHDVSSSPGTGMIDCGATASAAPEAVVRGLISAVLTQDKGTLWLDMTVRDAEFDEQELVPQFPRQLPLLGAMASSATDLHDPDPETAALLAASYQAKAAKAKAKSRPRSFDSTRRMKADPRDPRTQATQWPCFGRHIPAAPEANPHGQWINCSVCNLRMLYTPRKGSPASSTQTLNAPMVTKMLDELRGHLGTTKPTAKICLHAMNKITAEAVLEKSIKDLLEKKTTANITSPTSTAWGMVDDEELVAAYENANQFIKEALDEDPETQVYFEWPHPCFGWKQEPMQDLERHLEVHSVPWLSCRIDGCNYGMKDLKGEFFLQKKWLIKTTDENFHRVFRAKVPSHGIGDNMMIYDFFLYVKTNRPYVKIEVMNQWIAMRFRMNSLRIFK
ncbi:unnamed protein product [Symbiodinium sp. CCMP2592]|nr:unnamed protein product [Symbiodinium sp. CCMP2592]